MTRRLVWFSAGAASAVATALTIAEHGHDEVFVVYIDTGVEHPDNRRFLDDCSAWFGHSVRTARNERYRDTWQVWEDRRYLVGTSGAPCTVELKKKVRYRLQVELADDVQVYGYTADPKDVDRAARFREQNPDVVLETPLIDQGLTHADCLGIIERQGVEIPVMYRLGYRNNNCIPCVKGAIGYWNKIRRDFPAEFARMALLEREIGHSVLKEDTRTFDGDPSIWLDELDPERGDYPNEADIDCSLLCVLAEQRIAVGRSEAPDLDQDGDR